MARSVTAIVLAAGASSRFGADKLLALLRGRPLLSHTLSSFEVAAAVDDVVLVVSPERLAEFQRLASLWQLTKLRAICGGGARRQDSVLNGLLATDAEWVLVHDGARPMVTPALIDRCLDAAADTGAAICGVPVADTLKRTDAGGIIVETPPRDGLWAAQTPQVFRRDLLLAAHERWKDDVTDDAALIELLGHHVRMVEGASWNIKVTRADDLALAEGMLWERSTAEEVGGR